MRLRNLIATLAITAGIAAAMPAAANASLSQELKASGWVERFANRHWPRYYTIANCDQYSRSRFWCDVSGQSGDCFLTGHASVKRTMRRDGSSDWWVWWHGMHRDCF